MKKDDYIMAVNVDKSDGLEKQQLPHDADDQIKFSGESRRQFATSGLAVSGIILTLASRPVLGEAFCSTPSGFVSGNTSQHGECPVIPPGVTLPPDPNETFIAAFPMSNPSNTSYNSRRCVDIMANVWTEPQTANVDSSVQVAKSKLGAASYMMGTRSSSGSNYLTQKGKGSNNITSPTPTAVVAPPDLPPYQTQVLLQHLVKALYRARSGATPYLSQDTIRSMFYEWQSRGVFSPTASVDWNAAQIIDYLKQTGAN
ncbi:MAG: hypothetical protein ABL862_08915 [Candidatus Nitrotoga sp.]|jgi:hypothetical protein